MSGFTFDAGGLIALERGHRRVATLIEESLVSGSRVTVPATALAQVVRNPARQAVLARLLKHKSTRLRALDARDAIRVGVLLGKSGTADIADAHVAVCALNTGQPVITSDPSDLKRLAPELELVVV